MPTQEEPVLGKLYNRGDLVDCRTGDGRQEVGMVVVDEEGMAMVYHRFGDRFRVEMLGGGVVSLLLSYEPSQAWKIPKYVQVQFFWPEW